MSDLFLALPASRSVIAELSASVPANPFATLGYFESRRQTGWTSWVLVQGNTSGEVTCGCGAFMKRKGLNRKLEIPSLPALPDDTSFWVDLRAFCRRHYVTKLELGTFGSPPGVRIPAVGGCPLAAKSGFGWARIHGSDQCGRRSRHCMHRTRCEWILDLDLDIDAQIDRRHKAHIKKARRAGVVVKRGWSIEAVSAHRAMIGNSMERRRARGEEVPSVGPSGEFVALLQSGAGELYQAVSSGEVLSSGLVLRSPNAAYFHTRGTSPEGMAIGASHIVVHSIMTQLKAEGMRTFNIGGADEGSGLERFKKRFGASPAHTESATCYLGPLWAQDANRAVELLRSDWRLLLRSLPRRVSSRSLR